jgi:hypothetical protein
MLTVMRRLLPMIAVLISYPLITASYGYGPVGVAAIGCAGKAVRPLLPDDEPVANQRCVLSNGDVIHTSEELCADIQKRQEADQ